MRKKYYNGKPFANMLRGIESMLLFRLIMATDYGFPHKSFWTQPHTAIAVLILKGLEYFVTRLKAVDYEK